MNKKYKIRLLFSTMALAFSMPLSVQASANTEVTIEEAVADVSGKLDQAISDFSSLLDKTLSSTADAVKNKIADHQTDEAQVLAAQVHEAEAAAAAGKLTTPNRCRPELQADFLANSAYLALNNKNLSFQIDNAGKLLLGSESVSLDATQLASLVKYQKTVRDDLAFIHNYMNEEITATWQVFDQMFAEELGENSKLRAELKTFHDKLIKDINDAYSVENNVVTLDHQALTEAVTRFEKSIPGFISSVSIKGFSDITELSKEQSSKFKFISAKVKSLKARFVADLKAQRSNVRILRDNVCNRFTQWEEQEKVIRAQIPALANWQSIRFAKKD